MTPEAVLAHVLDAGGTVVWDWTTTLGRPGLQVPRVIAAEIEAATPEIQHGIRVILHRAGVFRRLATKRGPEIPWMTLPRAPKSAPGRCISCDTAVDDGSRCSACLVALELALGLWPHPDPAWAVR